MNMTTPDQIREAVTPEIGKWYELKGGAIVPCLELEYGQGECYMRTTDEIDPAYYQSPDWVRTLFILREVPNPHDRIAQLEAENEEQRRVIEGLQGACDVFVAGGEADSNRIAQLEAENAALRARAEGVDGIVTGADFSHEVSTLERITIDARLKTATIGQAVKIQFIPMDQGAA